MILRMGSPALNSSPSSNPQTSTSESDKFSFSEVGKTLDNKALTSSIPHRIPSREAEKSNKTLGLTDSRRMISLVQCK